MTAVWAVIIAMGWPTVIIIITINIIAEIREVISVNSTPKKNLNTKGRMNDIIISTQQMK